VFTLSRTLAPAMVLIAILFLAAAFVPAPRAGAKAGLALLALLLTNLPIYRYYARAKGVAFAIVCVPMHIVVQSIAASALCIGWMLRDVLGDVSPDAATQAYSEV